MANKKEFTVVSKRYRRMGEDSITEFTGTIEHLTTNVFGYTLECGKSWEHEEGNKKINKNPKGIVSLIKNLNNAVNNSAANGYSNTTYSQK